MFKKLIVSACVLLLSAIAARADRIDSEGNEVKYDRLITLNYQMDDFDNAKNTSAYGASFCFNSFSHWGKVHVGANLEAILNAGIIDDWGLAYNFGPSVRFDLGDRAFVNIPVDAVCVCTNPKGKSGTKVDWGIALAPSLHLFISDKIGIFFGPRVSRGFGSGSDFSFGMQAGIDLNI